MAERLNDLLKNPKVKAIAEKLLYVALAFLAARYGIDPKPVVIDTQGAPIATVVR